MTAQVARMGAVTRQSSSSTAVPQQLSPQYILLHASSRPNDSASLPPLPSGAFVELNSALRCVISPRIWMVAWERGKRLILPPPDGARVLSRKEKQ